MRAEIMKRLEKLEAGTRAKLSGQPDYGARLSDDEWRQVLSFIDPDPNVAFAAVHSDRLDVFTVLVGSPHLPTSYADLVVQPEVGSHYAVARLATWWVATGGAAEPAGSVSSEEFD
ncbi:hypothetical protein, partial [Aureimonas sp. SK2]|uniref:hypothetical protein n=1 Tax=Aureimonas sp. SK2 TaxID=3015992 RepID=UPI0024440DD5